MPPSTRNFFETRFKHDFCQVRVHTDSQAAKVAGALNARAFTIGQDVVFGSGQYTPGTNMGKRLLAHELTHVLQQRGGHAPQTLQREQGPTPRTTGSGTTPTPAPPTHSSACRVLSHELILAGQRGVIAYWDAGYVLSAGHRADPGMSFYGFAQTNRRGCGRVLFVQNVMSSRQINFKDGSVLLMSTNQWHLDGHDPYPSWPGARPNDPRDLYYITNDSPMQSTGRLGSREYTQGVIQSIQVIDLFRMYFMFQPRGRARQSLRLGEWHWNAVSNNTETAMGRGSLMMDPSLCQIFPQEAYGRETSDQPVTSPNADNLTFTVLSQTPSGTLAHTFESVLNGQPRWQR
jgi:hypothetical protein